MDLLIIGGTHFVGRAIVEDAVARGHGVTVFHRGPAEPEGFPDVEHVHGDRDGGLGTAPRQDVGCGDRYVRLRPARGARLGAAAVRRGRDVRLRLDPLRLSGRCPGRHRRGDADAPAAVPRDRGDHGGVVRPPQGRLRARGAAGVPGTMPDRTARLHRRSARSFRPVHVLGSPRRQRRPDAGSRPAGAAAPGRRRPRPGCLHARSHGGRKGRRVRRRRAAGAAHVGRRARDAGRCRSRRHRARLGGRTVPPGARERGRRRAAPVGHRLPRSAQLRRAQGDRRRAASPSGSRRRSPTRSRGTGAAGR